MDCLFLNIYAGIFGRFFVFNTLLMNYMLDRSVKQSEKIAENQYSKLNSVDDYLKIKSFISNLFKRKLFKISGISVIRKILPSEK